MTIVDTVADRYYGAGKEGRIKMAFAFAELLNQEARALEADGVDIIQFDEPAFNVYMADAAEWGVAALERAAEGLKCKTAVHICYGYGIKANVDWKGTLGNEWRQYEQVFPALAKSSIDQVSLECFHSHVPAELMRLLDGKDVMVGVIDVASDVIETPEEIAETIATALRLRAEGAPVPVHQLRPGADAARRRRGQAGRAGAGRGPGARAPRPMSAAALHPPTTPPDEARDGAARAWPRRSRAGRLCPLHRCRDRRARRAQTVVGRPAARRPPARRRPLPAPPSRQLRRRRGRDPARAAARALAAGRIQRPARRPRALVRADRAGGARGSPHGSACCGRSPRWRRS